ncbi:type II toxin-antitoxin system VapC family toxin [Acidithiobacillus sp. IBUN Pt1247-S3]|uniref:type II toxin-antitoxin system VapC family toxin n=1 Tax=Acidithiobacillus sp. IBUN Pt1247-S3 TaxID=3166642 RepID=UPI0034E580F9
MDESGYLVDTNVISEARKGKNADPGVLAFWQEVNSNCLYLAVQSIGEIRRGVENLRYRGDPAQAQRLGEWLRLLIDGYQDRILPFDADCAEIWGKLMSPHPHHPVDKQIAAIALSYGLTVVTRNVRDFADSGVALLNPFQ